MEQHQVVPDVIDEAPIHVAVVQYDSDLEMSMGNELKPNQVKNQPVNVQWPIEPETLYTVVFTDPDAPSRSEPTYREIKHWIVFNVPENNLSAGDCACSYVGSRPPSGSGLHRYVLLVYRQSFRIDPSEEIEANKTREGRLKFKVRSLIEKYKLITPAWAGNFYQAQYDDYVATVRGQSQQ